MIVLVTAAFGIAVATPADPGRLPPVVADARTGLSALRSVQWHAEHLALVIELEPARHYELFLSQRGLWHLAGVPAGILIEHAGMTCTLSANGEHIEVGRTDSPVGVAGIVAGVRGADTPVLLTLWFDLPDEVRDRAAGRPLTEAWDVDCDGLVSPVEWGAITQMLVTNDTAGVVGLDPGTVTELGGIVPIPEPPACPAEP